MTAKRSAKTWLLVAVGGLVAVVGWIFLKNRGGSTSTTTAGTSAGTGGGGVIGFINALGSAGPGITSSVQNVVGTVQSLIGGTPSPQTGTGGIGE